MFEDIIESIKAYVCGMIAAAAALAFLMFVFPSMSKGSLFVVALIVYFVVWSCFTHIKEDDF